MLIIKKLTLYGVVNLVALPRGDGKPGFGESGIRRRFYVVLRIKLESSENWVVLWLRNG